MKTAYGVAEGAEIETCRACDSPVLDVDVTIEIGGRRMHSQCARDLVLDIVHAFKRELIIVNQSELKS